MTSPRYVLVGHATDDARTRIVEERLGPGLSRVFEGDPRHCAATTDHEPHVHEYTYVRASQSVPTRGSYGCDGVPWILPPLPEGVSV